MLAIQPRAGHVRPLQRYFSQSLLPSPYKPYIISLYEAYKGKGKTIMPQKKPFITLAQAKEIAADIPTPFHLYDEKGIRENARRSTLRSAGTRL